jgi:transposase
MAKSWKTAALETVRRLTIERVCDGDTPREAAEQVGVSLRSVRRWLRAWRCRGEEGLIGGHSPGAPRKLTSEQESQILGWLEAEPGEFGFPTQRWTAVRLGVLIEHFFGVQMNHRYLNAWLWHRGITPQLPQRKPRERDDQAIETWVRHEWPRIKKKSAIVAEL